jgi:hypothetical protein
LALVLEGRDDRDHGERHAYGDDARQAGEDRGDRKQKDMTLGAMAISIPLPSIRATNASITAGSISLPSS